VAADGLAERLATLAREQDDGGRRGKLAILVPEHRLAELARVVSEVVPDASGEPSPTWSATRWC
jgi:hypothetical protein